MAGLSPGVSEESKMNSRCKILSIVAIAVMLTACGKDDSIKEAAECVFPDAPDTDAPGWVCDQPVEGLAVSAVGVAEKSAAGHSFMKNMAATDARVQLAQRMQVQVENMVKQYAETTGAADTETVDKVNTSVTKQITDQSLLGTKIYKTINSPNGSLYVLLGMDENATAEVTQNALRTSMRNDAALWQQFKAQKAQEELAASISEMRQQQ